MVDAVKVFRKAGDRRQYEKQRRIWQVFGVDYQRRIRKQRRIWEALYRMGKVKAPLPPLPPFQHRPIHQKIKPFIHPSHEKDYKALKQAVLDHLKYRPTFSNKVDPTLIDRLARIWALWILYEGWVSVQDKEASSRLIDAFYKIDRMLSRAMQELRITPSMRRKIAQDLEEDDKITRKLRRLLREKQKQKRQEKKQEKKQEAGG